MEGPSWKLKFLTMLIQCTSRLLNHCCVFLLLIQFVCRAHLYFFPEFKKDYFTSTSCEALYGLETNLVCIVLAQFYPSMAIIQPPQHSMILIIQGATDYPCLEDCHGTNYKIFLLYCYYKFFNLWNNILPMVWVY